MHAVLTTYPPKLSKGRNFTMAVDMFQFSLDNQDSLLDEDPAIEEVSLVRSYKIVVQVCMLGLCIDIWFM